MIMNRFNNISLFGGAMTVRLPANFIDVSDLRQVPDNQEVFLNSDGFESITVDILERVEGEIAPETTVDTDLKALKYHVREIVDSDEPDISSVSTVTVSHLPEDIPCMTCFVRASMTENGTYTAILVLLMRLEEKVTDLVVSLNLPGVSITEDAATNGDQAQLSTRLQDGRTAMAEIISSFDIKDWTLFS